MRKRDIHNVFSYMPMVLVLIGLFYLNYHKPLKTITVEVKSVPTTVYYSGSVRPSAIYFVLTPIDGVITEVKVPYGQDTKKGQALFTVESLQLADRFRESLEALVKASKAFQNLTYQHNGNAELFKLGLISKIAFMENTQQLENSELELYEARTKLTRIYESTGRHDVDVKNLNLSTMDEIRNLLSKPLRKLDILANEDGILYYPSKVLESGEGDKAIKVTHGTNVKEGQTLAVIGNFKGLVLEISVNEIDLHKLKLGQKGKITGAAFPGIELEGMVNNISRQADSGDSGSLPIYIIRIVVPQLTPDQRKAIQVGMSAEVVFSTPNPPSFWVPIEAVVEKDGGNWVTLVDKDDNVKEVQVETGTTDLDSIQILKGLTAGDRIAVHN